MTDISVMISSSLRPKPLHKPKPFLPIFVHSVKYLSRFSLYDSNFITDELINVICPSPEICVVDNV